MLEVKQLKKYYGKHRGIEQVSFNISKGEIYGLIGPNGAGKTTTIRIILDLLSADTGEIHLEGKVLPKYLNSMKHRIGYLPGEINLYPQMRVSRFLKYNSNFYKTYDEKYEDELCDDLGLDKKKRFKELSMGNRKKVGIIQALVHKPDILILDEPTNGLDPLLQKNFYTLVEKERERGCAILFSSHNLLEVERLSDRVGIIKEGVLIKEMSINQLSVYTQKVITVHGLKNGEQLEKFEKKESSNSAKSFLIKKSELKGFLTILNKLDYTDVEIKNPTLEETFMAFYDREDK
ncbi:MAG: ABC transporter ATP-binding protein [Thermotogota bacterium]|nr:ABC transporter ATP-binding protein [Thermotogota bacterium]